MDGGGGLWIVDEMEALGGGRIDEEEEALQGENETQILACGIAFIYTFFSFLYPFARFG